MKENKFVSSVCFVRKYGYEWSSSPKSSKVLSSLSFDKQIITNNNAGIRGTYLLEYDAFSDEYYREKALKEQKENSAEIGIWLEIVRPLVHKAGLEWRSEQQLLWDFHVNPGFLMSYVYEDKIKLIDTYMNEFKEFFGFFPKTVGAWLIDSESMEYMSKNYNIDAIIICREQWGMDGYTLWGGPYYGAYYPCKNNMQCPAQTIENQIQTPVFRMYVNDPIYCYYEYANSKYNDIDYGLFTQEPAWMCGQDPKWVEWHYENTFKESNIGFEYTQLGQEGGFTWERISEAYESQMQFAIENKGKFGYEFVTLSEMGRKFKKKYSQTPSNMRYVLDDWAEKGNKSVWFNNRKYRINVFSDKEKVWIRDIHLFDERYCDRYLSSPCTTNSAIYDNPPIMDGIRFSNDENQAGMYFGPGEITDVRKNGEYCEIFILVNNNMIILQLFEEKIVLTSSNDFSIHFKVSDVCDTITSINIDSVEYIHGGFKYKLLIERGEIKDNFIHSENGELVLSFCALK